MMKKLTMFLLMFFVLLGFLVYFLFYKELLPKQAKPTLYNVPNMPTQDISETTPTENPDDTNPNILVIEGVVQSMERPAPDIMYDYKIKTDDLLHDDIYGGESGSYVDEFPLQSADVRIMAQIKQSLGKRVTLTGSIEWGYAETRVFVVTKIN